MTALTDPARHSAIDTYAEAHRSLLDDARKADLEESHWLAREIRYKAAIVARAAEAEEVDPELRG